MILTPQRLTSPTIKVRRIGYLIQSTRILSSIDSLPAGIFIDKLIDWSKKNKRQLEQYTTEVLKKTAKSKVLPGEITGNDSAMRYIKVCNELGLVTNQINTRIWMNTKEGSILASLEGNKEYPFELSLEQICFLLKLFLQKDYDYLKVLVGLIGTRLIDESEKFRTLVIDSFELKFRHTSNIYEFEELKRGISDIKKWKKGKKYYQENIRDVRLGWLRDLKLLFLSSYKGRYLINDAEKLFINPLITKEWLDNDYYSTFAQCYKKYFKRPIILWDNLTIKKKKQLFLKCLEEANTFFRSPGMPSISASQFFGYGCCVLLCRYGVVATHNSLHEYLSKLSSEAKFPYNYRRMISDADRGYIIKKSN